MDKQSHTIKLKRTPTGVENLMVWMLVYKTANQGLDHSTYGNMKQTMKNCLFYLGEA